MEVIALLAKQDLSPSLEAALRGRTEDQSSLGTRRTLQRQRRLTPSEAIRLGRDYSAGSSVGQLAKSYGIHRTTVLAQLERQSVDRRRTGRKLTGDDVERAAVLYLGGESLKATGSYFGVDAETIRREFHRAGVPVRGRRGWS